MRPSLLLSWVAALLMAALPGCDTLPSAGPTTIEVPDGVTDQTAGFVIVPLSAQNVRLVGPPLVKSLNDTLHNGDARPGRPGIDIGDELTVSIWEPSSDGLFSTTDNKQTQINVKVDQSQSIFIPYAGRISVAGFGVEELRDDIASKLRGQAIDPQVQVTLISRESQNITVVGDVVAPGQFTVPPSGLRLIEAVALANGTRAPSFETELVIVRGTTRAAIRMDAVLAEARNNIWLRPEDTVQVRHRPRSFTAFGAVTSQNLQLFQSEQVTLAEALAQSGGLNDNLADAGGVFLFRYETARRLDQAGVALPAQARSSVPTIYQLDFSQPEAFFVAGAFAMRNKDIVYVANAPATDLQKFMATILTPLLGSAQAVDALGH